MTTMDSIEQDSLCLFRRSESVPGLWNDRTRSAWGRLLWRVLICAAWCLAPSAGPAAYAKAPLALQGNLLSVPGTGPVLRIHGKDTALAGNTSFLFHILQDNRLLKREVRLEGEMKPDGTFEVQRLYTVRNGKVYKIRYFCEVCNIEALEPGDCVCCQQPTELQEITVHGEDHEIYITH